MPSFRFDARHKKAWNRRCCPFHVSRLSHCPFLLNEQRKNPRRYEYSTPKPCGKTLFVLHIGKGMRIHTSRGHLRCLCSRQKFVICEITIRLKQSACKRLLCLDSRCPPFHFGASVLQFGVGCLGNKAEQNTSAVSNSPKTSKSRCKSSKKKSNNSKNLWFSSISSHF